MKFLFALAGALACTGLCLVQPGFSQPAATRGAAIIPPVATATVTSASYCFARVRGLDPGRLPPSYLVLKLKVTVAYSNPGTRSLILPLERKRTVYAAINPDEMRVLKEEKNLFAPELKIMRDLPPDVSPDSPVSPKNDVFAIIPAGGEMTPPLLEEITLPIASKGLFNQSPDLRGHRVYIELRFLHRDMTAALGTDLSDRWSKFGFPWTGILTTNKIAVDVPATPEATGPCVDTIKTHPVASTNHN